MNDFCPFHVYGTNKNLRDDLVMISKNRPKYYIFFQKRLKDMYMSGFCVVHQLAINFAKDDP